MDAGAGIVFGLLEIGCAATAFALVVPDATGGVAVGRTVWLSVGAVVASLAVEVASHLLLQGYPPSPPARATTGLPVAQKLGFALYFVITFGMFFLTLDLAMRLCGYRPAQHQQANAIAGEWHGDALAKAPKARELHWHQRAIAEQMP